MKLLIIVATNRKNSLSSYLGKQVQDIYKKLHESTDILDLKHVDFKDIVDGSYENPPESLKPHLNMVAKAQGLIIICPEYNGSIPGLIKHFIDHWIYPDSFVYKPVCFIGLGGRFGALTPISQLQSIFLYRHSFVFPVRVFIQNVSQLIKQDHKIQDSHINQLLVKQATNFIKFIKALKTETFVNI